MGRRMQLCPSLAIGGPSPAAKSPRDRASERHAVVRVPLRPGGGWGSGNAVFTESWPTRDLLTARCVIAPIVPL